MMGAGKQNRMLNRLEDQRVFDGAQEYIVGDEFDKVLKTDPFTA